MLTFKESFNEVIEAKLKLPKGEKVAKELTKLGKKKNVTAVITSKFNLYIDGVKLDKYKDQASACLLYTSPSPRDGLLSRMPSSA